MISPEFWFLQNHRTGSMLVFGGASMQMMHVTCHPGDVGRGIQGNPLPKVATFITRRSTHDTWKRMLHPYGPIPSMYGICTYMLVDFVRDMWCKYTIHGCYGLGCSVCVWNEKNRGKWKFVNIDHFNRYKAVMCQASWSLPDVSALEVGGDMAPMIWGPYVFSLLFVHSFLLLCNKNL